MTEIIKLNVGGVLYTTTRSTLTTYPESMLGAMFSGSMPTTLDDDGNYFIDRDGGIFIHVLNFLRSSTLALPEDFKSYDQLALEADFYQILPLIKAIQKKTYHKPAGIFLYAQYFSEYIPVRFRSVKREVLELLAKKYKASGNLDNEEDGDLVLRGREIQKLNIPYEINEYLHENGGQIICAYAITEPTKGYEYTWLLPNEFGKSTHN